MADRIKDARELGDLKENADYHLAKEAQAHLETRIKRLRQKLRDAEVVEIEEGDGSFSFGRTAEIVDEATNGYASLIEVTLHRDGRTVTDYLARRNIRTLSGLVLTGPATDMPEQGVARILSAHAARHVFQLDAHHRPIPGATFLPPGSRLRIGDVGLERRADHYRLTLDNGTCIAGLDTANSLSDCLISYYQPDPAGGGDYRLFAEAGFSGAEPPLLETSTFYRLLPGPGRLAIRR